MSMRIILIMFLTAMFLVGSLDAQYTAYVKNFRYSPVLIKPLKKGPGFTIENKSNKPVAKFRFGCVKEVGEPPSIVFTFIPEEIPLDAQGSHSKMTFKNWTPTQFACSNRYAMIAVIEVLFQDGDSWSAPLKFDRVIAKTNEGYVIP